MESGLLWKINSTALTYVYKQKEIITIVILIKMCKMKPFQKAEL